MYCTSCGTHLPDTAAFCSRCGTNLAEADHKKRVNACFKKILSMANKRKGTITEEQARVLLYDYGSEVVEEASDMYRKLWKDGHFRK